MFHKIEEELDAIRVELARQDGRLKRIERQTSPRFPVRGLLIIGELKQQGDKVNQLQDSQKAPYWAAEFDAAGVPALDPGDSVALTVDAATGTTIVPDAAVDTAKLPAGMDPTKVLQTGFVVGGKTPGTANITATFAHTDGTPAPPPVTIQVSIVSGPPVTGNLGLGAPVSQ